MGGGVGFSVLLGLGWLYGYFIKWAGVGYWSFGLGLGR